MRLYITTFMDTLIVKGNSILMCFTKLPPYLTPRNT